MEEGEGGVVFISRKVTLRFEAGEGVAGGDAAHANPVLRIPAVRSNDSKAAEAGQPGQKAPDATVKEAAARRELSLSLGFEEAFLSRVFDT